MGGMALHVKRSAEPRIRVRALEGRSDVRPLEPLLADISRELSRAYREWGSEETVARHHESRIAALLKDPACYVAVANQGSRPAGIAAWRVLPWDTGQFGFPAAKIDLLAAPGAYRQSRDVQSALLRRILRDAAAQHVRHLTARVDAGSMATIHALEGCRFETIDGIQTFAFHLGSIPPDCPSDVETRLFRDADLEQVLAISRRAYILDRFHADPALERAQADAIHEEWVRNSCLGITAEAVVVACDGDRVLGYETCLVDRGAASSLGMEPGSIGLVATSEEARGRGVATAATCAALKWFRDQKVELVEVGTQLRNIPASRLYEKCGFRLARVSLTLRRLL